jgi:hypothetical protein
MPPRRAAAPVTPPAAAPVTPPARCTEPLDSAAKSAAAAQRAPAATPAPACAVNTTPIQQSPTVALREDPGYASLKHAACADSFHDFGHGGKSFNKLRNDYSTPGLSHVTRALNDSKWRDIPNSRGQANGLREENDMMEELFANAAADLDFASTKDLVTAIEEAGGSLLLDLQNTTIYGPQQYDVKLLQHDGNYDAGMSATAAKITTADIFNLFGKTTVNLLFDASVINITSRFINAPDGGAGPITINRIVNREIVNDPAPKTYEKSASDKAAVAIGNTYNILFEKSNENITYVSNPADLYNNELQRNKFFSKMDLTLTPFDTNDRQALPRIRMTITDPKAGGAVVYTNDDPHQNNNIAKCWNRIKNLNKIASDEKANPAKLDEMGVHFQCKRSGDWLQALSCLDIGRTFLDDTGKEVDLATGNIILVTHDRILLWYALFMGIDVIMSWKDTRDAGAVSDTVVDEEGADDEDADTTSKKRLIYFNNARRAASPEERHLRMIDIADTLYGLSDHLLVYINTYNGFLQTIKNKRLEAIQALLNNQPITNDSEAKARDSFNDCIQNILRAYWQYYSMTYSPMDKSELIAMRTAYFEARNSFLPIKDAYTANAFDPAAANYESELEKCSKIATKFISKCRAVQTLENKFSTMAALEAANEEKCKTDELYTNMPLIGSKVLIERTRKGVRSADGNMVTHDAAIAEPLTPNQRVAMLATHFVDNAKPDDIKLLYNYINKLTLLEGDAGARAGFLRTKASESYMPLFLVTLRPGFSKEDIRTVAPDATALRHINTVIRDEVEEHKNMYTALADEADASYQAAPEGTAERSAAAAEIEEAEAAEAAATAAATQATLAAAAARAPVETSAAAAAEAAEAELEEQQKAVRVAAEKATALKPKAKNIVANGLATCSGEDKRPQCEGVAGATTTGVVGRVRAFLNSATSRLNLAKYFNIVVNYFTGVRGGGHVGGDPEVVKHTAYYTMFNFYMMELTTQLGSFETADNEDYIYYDALARLVLAATANKDNAPGNLRYSRYVSYLYEQIPQLTKETGLAFYKDGDFMRNVAFVGRNMALQSLSMASSDLPSLAYGATTNVPLVVSQKTVDGETHMSPYAEEYARLKAELKSNHKTFAERQRALCMELMTRIEMSASPDSPEFGQTAVAATVAQPDAAAPAAVTVSSYNALVNEISQKGVQKISDREVKAYIEKIKGMISSGEIDPTTITPEARALYEQLEQREKARVAKLMIAVGSKNVNPLGTRGFAPLPEGIAARGGGRRTRKIRGGARGRGITRKQRGYKRCSTRGGSRKQRN